MEFKELTSSKICVIYAYYERKNQEKNQTNLSFFINYALDNSKWLNLDITYVFLINGTQCGVIIPNRNDIHVIYNDSNTYSDYEAWMEGIIYLCKLKNQQLWKTYDYMCLINAGTCGPFMDEDTQSHWLYPFYRKMVLKNAVACSPYANLFELNKLPVLSCHFTLFKIDENIMNLLLRTKLNGITTVLGKKHNKMEAIMTGEYGLSEVLLKYNKNICCLFYEDIHTDLRVNVRREFYHETNKTILINTIFIKNVWRYQIPNTYASKPVLYKFCKNFIKNKLKYNNIFEGISTKYNWNLLNVSHHCNITNEAYYLKYGFAEEDIIFPIKGTIINNSCVIYAHYDEKNIIANYVIEGLKALIYLGYDILFYTACKKIINIDLSILPFSVNFIENAGAGTDWMVFLIALKKIKTENVNYDWIMIMNDSLLFPIHGISNFINSINDMRNTSDFWGHWQSDEISWHLVGVPIEFKSALLDTAINFINSRICNCRSFEDFIVILETKFAQNFIDNGYKYNSIIKYADLKCSKTLTCRIHHPYIISQWINNTKSFAIKWKYCISYLNNNFVSGYFNYLAKYLHYGPNSGVMSKGEIAGVFPPSKEAHKLFL